MESYIMVIWNSFAYTRLEDSQECYKCEYLQIWMQMQTYGTLA